MGLESLPFGNGKSNGTAASHSDKGGPTDCPVFRMLPKPLQEHSKKHPHLWDYLHLVPVEKVGVPLFHEKLSRNLKDMASPNLIYPVSDGVFVHIYLDALDARDYYIAVEPGMALNLGPLMDQLELLLVDLVQELDAPSADGAGRKELLLKCLNKVCLVRKSGVVRKNGNVAQQGNRIVVSPQEMEALRYLVVRDKEGMGPLQPMVQDPNIEDISCSGLGPIFVEHKIFQGLKSSITFSTFEELDSFVIRLSEKIGKPVSYRDPIVDATLPDGSRINIVFGSDVSKRGSNFTIRKFSSTPMSVLELVEFGTLSYEMAAYLSLVIGEGMNLFVSGETASGKTTTLNAITTFISPSAKIVSIEDTPELQVPHPNWTREVVRGSTKASSGSAVGMFDLLKAALRQRPNIIIIGEIRGEEGAIAFQAMQTGHAAMATFHAASVEKLIQRLTGSPINIPKTYVDNLNVVVIQSAVRLPTGKTGRRVVSINEIVGYDPSSDSFSYIEVFRWDPVQDRFEFTGNMNSYLLEHKVALKRGIPLTQKRKIYNELSRRADVLRRLSEQKVNNFYALYGVLSQAYKKGLFR